MAPVHVLAEGQVNQTYIVSHQPLICLQSSGHYSLFITSKLILYIHIWETYSAIAIKSGCVIA